MDYAQFYPIMALQAHGSFSKLWVHKEYKTFKVVAKYYYPENPRTGEQQSHRALFYDAVYNWRHFDAATKNYYNQFTFPRYMSGYNRYLSFYLNANYPMIIYWQPLEQSASQPLTLPDYFAEPYFSGIQRVRTLAAYPSTPPYGSLFHHSTFKKLFTFLEDSGWGALPSPAAGAGALPMVILSKSSSVNQDVGGANDTEVWWTWDGEVKKDTGFVHSTEENPERVQVSEAGWYLIRFVGNAQQTGAARTTLQGIIRVNGGSTLREGTIRDYTRGASYGNVSPGLETIKYLAADDYIEVGTKVEDTDGVYTINSNGAEIADEANRLMITKVA